VETNEVSVTIEDVRHIGALARLGLTDDRARSLVSELNTILEHMTALSRVDTTGVDPLTGVGVERAPLRDDAGPPVPLARAIHEFAPTERDGFFLVPRLATHEDDT
jgi:aspartyl-tRNA(Asn)/glutamyl-tRNA(Gln) amidotransferase subunit C